MEANSLSSMPIGPRLKFRDEQPEPGRRRARRSRRARARAPAAASAPARSTSNGSSEPVASTTSQAPQRAPRASAQASTPGSIPSAPSAIRLSPMPRVVAACSSQLARLTAQPLATCRCTPRASRCNTAGNPGGPQGEGERHQRELDARLERLVEHDQAQAGARPVEGSHRPSGCPESLVRRPPVAPRVPAEPRAGPVWPAPRGGCALDRT